MHSINNNEYININEQHQQEIEIPQKAGQTASGQSITIATEQLPIYEAIDKEAHKYIKAINDDGKIEFTASPEEKLSFNKLSGRVKLLTAENNTLEDDKKNSILLRYEECISNYEDKHYGLSWKTVAKFFNLRKAYFIINLSNYWTRHGIRASEAEKVGKQIITHFEKTQLGEELKTNKKEISNTREKQREKIDEAKAILRSELKNNLQEPHDQRKDLLIPNENQQLLDTLPKILAELQDKINTSKEELLHKFQEINKQIIHQYPDKSIDMVKDHFLDYSKTSIFREIQDLSDLYSVYISTCIHNARDCKDREKSEQWLALASKRFDQLAATMEGSEKFRVKLDESQVSAWTRFAQDFRNIIKNDEYLHRINNLSDQLTNINSYIDKMTKTENQ